MTRYGRLMAGTQGVLFLCVCVSALVSTPSAQADLVDVVRDVQARVVKIYGTGGMRRLEAYQTGVLISAEGHVLTVWSYVLDTDDVTVVLDDGRHYQAHMSGADPLTEIAVLKLDAAEEEFPHFVVPEAALAQPGTRVLAFSNLFGIASGAEPVSVMQGTVSAIAPLNVRRGAFTARFQGDVYVLDVATSNPGAAGGALTDTSGNLLGMLGKEARSRLTNTWLNFALPTAAFESIVAEILTGNFQPASLDELDLPDQPLTLEDLGIVLVPDVVERTPPFVDRVVTASPADRAGLKTDDLIVMIDGQPTTSCRYLVDLLRRYEYGNSLVLSVLRQNELLELSIAPVESSFN